MKKFSARLLAKWGYWLPIVITVMMLGLRLVHYSSVDDMYMLYVAESLQTNSHSEHLFFMSVIFGYLFKLLYSVTPAINWFCVWEIAAANLAFIAMHRIVKTGGGSVIATSVLAMLQVIVLNNITYTGLAFILPVAGGIWMLYYVDKLSLSAVKHLLFGCLLMLLGFCFRMGNAFYCVIILLVPLALIGLMNKRNAFSAVAVILILCCAANYAVIGIERNYRANHPEPQLYTEFQKYRSLAYDAPLPDYHQNEEALSEAGISENDLKLMHYALYGDINVFTSAAMKAIAQCNGFEESYDLNPIHLLKTFLESQKPYQNLFVCFLLLAVLAFIFTKKHRLEILAITLAVSANVVFLFFRKRGLARVYNPIAVSGIFILVLMLMCYKDSIAAYAKSIFKRIDIKKISAVICIVSALAAAGVNVYVTERDMYRTENVRTAVQEDTEHTYVAHAWARNYIHDRNLSVLRKNFMDVPVVVTMGEWYIYSDYWYDYHKNNGIEEYAETPYLYLLEDDVYYLTEYSNHADMIKEFFSENYHLKVDCQEVNTIPEDNNKKMYYIYNFYLAD